ncbi:tetratricopeptide repeat protein [Leeia sp. TBRC 13508]|uniref:Ancillary SecYEG translocon subunit n=1 Tax=Leeia speluncae TaxID=2884804 RepID=A0ABS8DAP7_9NEIS|nr:tetratricopeptide repeat protein [Leeia speluncae]MCB6185275.1 tetratricopeptide repeat protein [Leeia speluncae]
MAVYDLQEQEQIDALKAWWQDNKKFVVSIVTITLVGLAGYKGWKYWKNEQSAKAAVEFESLQQSVQQKNLAKAQQHKNALLTNYSESAYAGRGVLIISSAEIEAGKLNDATTDLQWLIQNSKELPIQDVARLRLASLKLDQKKFDEALSNLNAITTDGLKGLVSFQKGDVLLAKNDKAGAKTSFRLALEQLDQADPLRSVVEMKIDSLGGL